MKEKLANRVLPGKWETVDSPKWLDSFEPTYTPPICFKLLGEDKGACMDCFQDTFYLVPFWPHVSIYKHRTGGFMGIDVKFPIFLGRLEDDSYYYDLVRLFRQLGIPYGHHYTSI